MKASVVQVPATEKEIQLHHLKSDLFSTLDRAEALKDCFVSRPGRDFTRKSKISFQDVMRFVLSLDDRSLADEMDNYFGPAASSPSPEAMLQRRHHVSSSLFRFIFDAFNARRAPALWNGFELLAGDGSDVVIPLDPDDVETYQPLAEGSKGRCMLHMNVLRNLVDGTVEEAEIQPLHGANENHALFAMAERLTKRAWQNPASAPAIIVLDRGYESYNVIGHLLTAGANFVMRVKDVGTKGGILSRMDDVPEAAAEKFDVCLCRKVGVSTARALRRDPQYRIAHHEFDFVDPKVPWNDPGAVYPLSFRVVRIPIGNGKYESLVTNLPAETFPAALLGALYHKRWSIESGFSAVKYGLKLPKFSSAIRDFIRQEIYAKLTLFNFGAILAYITDIFHATDRYVYHLNFRRALKIGLLYLDEQVKAADIPALVNRKRLPVRPGRASPRSKTWHSPVNFWYRAA